MAPCNWLANGDLLNNVLFFHLLKLLVDGLTPFERNRASLEVAAWYSTIDQINVHGRPCHGSERFILESSENSSISLALIASVSEKSGGSASSLSVLRNPNVDSSLWLPSKACGVWLTGLSRTRSTDIFWTLSWSVFCVSTWEDGHPSFSRLSLMHVFLLNRDVLSREKTCNVVWQAIPCRLRSTFTVPLWPRLVPFAALTFWVSLAKFQIRSGSILFRSVKVIASTSEPLSGSHLILTSAWSLYWTPISINPSARLVVRWIQRWVILERFSKPNIRFGSGRTGSKIVSKFRLTHNRKLRSASRNTVYHTIACPALLLWWPAVENRGPCVPNKCSLSHCASPGDSFCQVLDHWWSHGQHLLPIHSLMMAMYLPKISCRSKKVHRQPSWMEASIWPC